MWSLRSFEHPPMSTHIWTFSPDDRQRSCFQNGVLCWEHMKTDKIHKCSITPHTSVSISQLLLWVLYDLWPFKKMTFWTELLPSKQLQLTKVNALLVIINIWDQVHISTYTVLQLSVLILKYSGPSRVKGFDSQTTWNSNKKFEKNSVWNSNKNFNIEPWARHCTASCGSCSFNSKVEQTESQTASWNGLCSTFEGPLYYVSLATNQQCSYISDTGMLLTHFTFPLSCLDKKHNVGNSTLLLSCSRSTKTIVLNPSIRCTWDRRHTLIPSNGPFKLVHTSFSLTKQENGIGSIYCRPSYKWTDGKSGWSNNANSPLNTNYAHL
jgi:hypothetical protein